MTLSKLRLALPRPSIPLRVLLLLTFLRWQRKQSIITAALDQLKAATVRILPEEPEAEQNVFRETSSQHQLLPAGQPQCVNDPKPSRATKAAIENPKSRNSTLKNLEKLDSEPPASPADKVTELLMIVTPPLLPAGQ